LTHCFTFFSQKKKEKEKRRVNKQRKRLIMRCAPPQQKIHKPTISTSQQATTQCYKDIDTNREIEISQKKRKKRLPVWLLDEYGALLGKPKPSFGVLWACMF
jgi:hypothetical protein